MISSLRLIAMRPNLLMGILLFVSLCNAEYIKIEGDDFNDYIDESSFQVRLYGDINDYDSPYGVPVPPEGTGSKAVYLVDKTTFTETAKFNLDTSGDVRLQFWFYCDHSASELEIRMSYPWQASDGNVYLCGPKADGYTPGEWNFGNYTRECYGSCSKMTMWLYGVSKNETNIVGIQSLEIATENSPLPDPKPCPEGFEKISGTCIYFSADYEKTRTWQDARTYCQAMGILLEENIDLAELSRGASCEADDTMLMMLNGKGERFWIGLSDAGGDDQWIWNSGLQLSKWNFHWAVDEPSNAHDGIDEDCGFLARAPNDRYNRLYINDMPCDQEEYFLCQIFDSSL